MENDFSGIGNKVVAPEPAAGENVVYQDSRVVVSDQRVTCNHITIPLGEIHYSHVAFRSNSLAAAIACVVGSATPFLLLTVPIFEQHWLPCVFVGVVMLGASAFWLGVVIRNYVDLWLSVGGSDIRVYSTSMGNRGYVYRVADIIAKELIKNKNLQEQRQAILDQIGHGRNSETQMLRDLLPKKEKEKDKKDKKK